MTEKVSLDKYKAVLFDLDGVLTNTAKVHSACWKKLFDNFLKDKEGDSFKPFTEDDYHQYVDGKMRYEGVKSFISSRGYELPFGSKSDSPGSETVCALGNQKDSLFGEVLESDGVEVYEGSFNWLKQILDKGLLVAVVSSSNNCKKVLKAGQINHYFPVIVDGNTIDELNLNGKPAPDGFLKAAKDLNVKPEEAIVVEDAISGVQAGKAGNFGLVIGVNRQQNTQTLIENGANIVVDDLAELVNA